MRWWQLLFEVTGCLNLGCITEIVHVLFAHFCEPHVSGLCTH